MRKKKVSFFISYAHANKRAMEAFFDRFKEQTAAARRFEYSYWNDRVIVPGDDWHNAIMGAIDANDFGLLLVSPAFLGSSYIQENELPHYLGKNGKRCFPVMLAPVDFNRHDLKGLEAKQIFRLDSSDFKEPRAFTELKPRRRGGVCAESFCASRRLVV